MEAFFRFAAAEDMAAAGLIAQADIYDAADEGFTSLATVSTVGREDVGLCSACVIYFDKDSNIYNGLRARVYLEGECPCIWTGVFTSYRLYV